MRFQAIVAFVILVAAGALLARVIGIGESEPPSADAAQREALLWTEAEAAERPRWTGDAWEVDVRRADGSLVEVTLGRELELRELDEELGPGGEPAHDELKGELRRRAIAAARSHAGRGVARSVELERDGSIEVNFVRSDKTVIEVELDEHLRLQDVDREEFGDE